MSLSRLRRLRAFLAKIWSAFVRFWRHPNAAAAVVVVAAVVAVVSPFVVLHYYGGSAVWTGLVGNSTASLLAFLCALAWDRRTRQRQRDKEDADRANQRAEEEADYERRIKDARSHELEERRSEAKRRFSLILAELRANTKFLAEEASGSLVKRMVLPQLSDGSWLASGGALGAIASDYELVADLSTFYGRVDELRWRLRYRLAIMDADEKNFFDAMTEPLIVKMKEELPGLVDRVSGESEQPSVIEATFISSPTVVFGPAVHAAVQARVGRVTRGSGSRPVEPPG